MGEVQITDIAIPSIYDKEIENKSDSIEIAMYCPPEIDNQLIGINYKCDIWSLGVLFYELYRKKHPFEANSGDDVTDLISKGSDRNDLSDGVIDNIIKGCFKIKPNLRPTLANIKRNLSSLYNRDEIQNEIEVRRASYGLASPNIKANNQDSNTEKLDEDDSEDVIRKEEYPKNEKYFTLLDKNSFSSDISSEIVYNRKREEELTRNDKFRLISMINGEHEGQINGIGVLMNGVVVTGGNNKKIHFWNPMDGNKIAIINELNIITNILTFPGAKEFYYSVGSKIKSFDYSSKVSITVYEGKSEITCLSRMEDKANLTILVGLKDGTIEFVNRLHKKITFSKPFHAGSSVISLSGKDDYLISSDSDEQVVVYNIKSTIIERELSLNKENHSNISGAIKIGGAGKEIIITDESLNNRNLFAYGVTWLSYDIENPNKEVPDLSYKPITRLFDFICEKPNTFATSNDKGEIRVWERSEVANGEAVSIDISELWIFKGHKGTASGMAKFKDGSFVTCGVDGTIRIWTCRKDIMKAGKVQKGAGGCCGSKCIIQ